MQDHTSDSQSQSHQSGEWRRWRPNERWGQRSPVILVAEDDPADQELIRRTLGRGRCNLKIVVDGVVLIDYMRRCREGVSDGRTPYPDLILLDLNMPKVDGRQALEQIRSMANVKQAPIVVFSTSSDVTDVKLCYEAGCSTYVTKPSELEEFRATLELIARYWLDLATLP